MIIPADIHTHCQPEVPGEAIVNCFPETFVPQLEGWYSVGIHPWYITSSTVSLAEKKRCLEELLYHPQVLAMGEAGLDKLADASLPLQREVFEYQARLAEETDKPLVIHLVKAVDDFAEKQCWQKNISDMVFTFLSEKGIRKKHCESYHLTGCFWKRMRA